MIRPRRRPPTRPAARPAAEPLEPRAYFAALSFAKAQPYTAGSDAAALAVADLNGDGFMDVVVANDTPGQGGVTVLFGAKDGTFTPQPTVAVPTSVQSVAVADVNGDGHPDVVVVGAVVGPNGGIVPGAGGTSVDAFAYVLLNTGDGTLAPPVAYAVGVHPEGVAIADVNGDGLPDVLTANQGVAGKGSLSVLLNTGNGTFTQPAVSYDAGPNPDALAVGDLNGDGYPDVVTVDPENDEVHVLLNRGTADPTRVSTTATDTGTFPTLTTDYTTDTAGRAVAITDVNNDARPDLVVANLRAANVGTFTNVGDGTFNGQVTYRTGGFPFAVASADLNGDSRPELITADSRDNAIGVLVHNAEGGFNRRADTTPLQFPTGTAPEAVAAVDVNGDGRPDLISADFNNGTATASNNGLISVLLNTTTLAPTSPTTTAVTATAARVQLGNAVTFTATVTPAPSTAYAAGRVVVFSTGTRALGVAKLAADGTATLTTKALPLGTDLVVARYSGNAQIRGSVASIEESVVAKADTDDAALLTATAVTLTSRAGRTAVAAPRSTAAAAAAPAARPADVVPLVEPTALTVTTPSPLVSGGSGAALLKIDDPNVAPAIGSVAVSLTIAPTSDPTAAVPLTVTGGGTIAVALGQNDTLSVPVRFTLPAALADGNYVISATLAPAGSFTAAQVSTTSVATPDMPGVPVVRVLYPFVPGDAGSALVTIANQGPGTASGSVAVSLSIAPADGSTAAVPLAINGPSAFALRLQGGTSRAVPVRFTIPADLTTGSYTITATLTAGSGLTAAQVSTTAAATAVPAPVVVAFGAVGVHLHHVITTTLGDGATVTLSITGPGTGTFVDDGDGALDLTLVDTTGGSTVKVTPAASNTAPVTIDHLAASNPNGTNYLLGGVYAPHVTLAGTATARATVFTLGTRRITLAGLTDADINLVGAYRTVVAVGPVVDSSMSTTGAFQSVAVASWTDDAVDVINANGIVGALTSGGDFGARLALTGAGLRQAVGSIDVAGNVATTVWAFGTDAGPITIGGSLIDTDVLAGATVVGTLGTGGDVFHRGRIASVTIGRDVTGSLVAAGFQPASDNPFTPVGGTLIPGGAIGRITVTGTVDPTSRFAAASLPRNV